MNKTYFLSLLILLTLCSVSAEIILEKQPSSVYNLGDSFSIPVILKSNSDVSGVFQMDLICEGHQINFYKNGVVLSSGEEKKLESSLVLSKSLIGNSLGDCVIKGTFRNDYVVTDNFRVSDLITISSDVENTELDPGEELVIEGNAIKENGDSVDGFLIARVTFDSSDDSSDSLEVSGTINDGAFKLKVEIPEDFKSGDYIVELYAYETYSDEGTTNEGYSGANFYVNQIPNNLEIVFDDSNIEPGSNLKVKAILHDQAGESIGGNVIISIKNSKGSIVEQQEVALDSFIEYTIEYNLAPAEWEVVAVAKKKTAEAFFNIEEKEYASIDIINKTLIIINKGNVPYDENISVRISDKTLNFPVYLKVDETKKYLLSAPEGNYDVDILSGEGTLFSANLPLTGDAISVREASEGIVSFVRNPGVWLFILLILCFTVIIIYNKTKKKSFVSYFNFMKGKKLNKTLFLPKKEASLDIKNKAILSLSMKGDKQNASLICIKIKNYNDSLFGKGSVREILRKIVSLAEEQKAYIYHREDVLFFIFSPRVTKTFKNETEAIKLAKKIESILKNHNRLFKDKIEFGLSINSGYIISGLECSNLNFSMIDNLMSDMKKIANISDGDLLLGENIKMKLKSDIKTNKHTKNNLEYYTIKQFVNREKYDKFIGEFAKKFNKEE